MKLGQVLNKYWGEVKVGGAVHSCISKEKVMGHHAHNTQEKKTRAQMVDEGAKIKERNTEDLVNKISRKISQICINI